MHERPYDEKVFLLTSMKLCREPAMMAELAVRNTAIPWSAKHMRSVRGREEGVPVDALPQIACGREREPRA